MHFSLTTDLASRLREFAAPPPYHGNRSMVLREALRDFLERRKVLTWPKGEG